MESNLNQKIAQLDAAVDWFYSKDFALDVAREKYEETKKLAKEIEEDLKNLKNEIEILN